MPLLLEELPVRQYAQGDQNFVCVQEIVKPTSFEITEASLSYNIRIMHTVRKICHIFVNRIKYEVVKSLKSRFRLYIARGDFNSVKCSGMGSYMRKTME